MQDFLVRLWRGKADQNAFIALVVTQFVLWTVLFEVAYKPVRLLLSKTAFWWRVGNRITNTGQTAWDEICFGVIISLQHSCGAMCMAIGIYYEDPSWFRFAIASEMAFEINDLLFIWMKAGRYHSVTPLITWLMTFHHVLGLVLGVPAAMYFADNVAVQYLSFSLLLSGTILCAAVVVQYCANRKTVLGCWMALIFNASHSVWFAWVRVVYPFTGTSYADVYQLVKGHSQVYHYVFVVSMMCMSVFSILITLLCFDRVAKTLRALLRVKKRLAQKDIIVGKPDKWESIIYTKAMVERICTGSKLSTALQRSASSRLRAAVLVVLAKCKMIRLVAARKMGKSTFMLPQNKKKDE